MAKLRYGIITFKGHPVGTLTETAAGGTVFEYYNDAPEIACALPRSESTHTYNYGIHPVFAHLAPEGWLRNRQSAIADADVEDDFGLLLAFGADCIGAIGIEDPDAHGKKFVAKPNIDLETEAITENRRTISGVQAKILCYQDGHSFVPASTNSPASHIAKFAREDLIDIVNNEATTLRLLETLLPKHQVNTFQTTVISSINKPALILKRFDREGPDANIKLRCEDFAQVIAIPPGRRRENKYAVDYTALHEALKYSEAPKIDALLVLERLIAYAILGNTDCHLKNWSLLETTNGLRLAPIYDALNCYIYGEQSYSTEFGLKLGDHAVQWDQVNRETIFEIGQCLNLNKAIVELTFKKIFKTKEHLFHNLYEPLGLNEHRTAQYRGSVETKWSDFYD